MSTSIPSPNASPTLDAGLLHAAINLVDEYVATKYRQQLRITVEYDPCAKHDHLLPPGRSRLRPSLATESGVAIFWQHDVPELRRFYAPQEDIQALVSRLVRILRASVYDPEEIELIAIEQSLGMYAYDYGDGKSYAISARYKDWAEREASQQGR